MFVLSFPEKGLQKPILMIKHSEVIFTLYIWVSVASEGNFCN